MKRRGRYGPVRGGAGWGGAAGCDTVACFYREYLYSGGTRLLRSQTELRDEENVYETLGWEGGREGGGENFFVCEYLYTVKGLIKRNGEVVCLSLTQHGGESEGVACSYDSIQNLKKRKKNDIQYGRHGGAVDQEGHGFDSGPGTFLCGVYSHYGLFVSCPGSPLSSHCRLL